MTEKPDAKQLRQIAEIGFKAGKDDFYQMIEHAHDAIADEFVRRGIAVADKGGLTAEFELAMEQAFTWLITEQFEARLKDQFSLIRKHRGYP